MFHMKRLKRLERWNERKRKERLSWMFRAMGIHPTMAMLLAVGERISSPKEKVDWKKEGF